MGYIICARVASIFRVLLVLAELSMLLEQKSYDLRGAGVAEQGGVNVRLVCSS